MEVEIQHVVVDAIGDPPTPEALGYIPAELASKGAVTLEIEYPVAKVPTPR